VIAAPAALSLRSISRQFGAVRAVQSASLEVRAGTVHALLGENGAGKSTLMRIAFGLLHADSGEISVRGAPCRFRSPAEAIAAGIGMVHQHFTLVPAFTVAENVALGGAGRYDAQRAADRVREVGAAAGLMLDPGARVDSLSVGAQQRVEIVKALARDATLLILDEPTAVLAPAEAAELLGWIRRFATGDRAAVLITHRLHDALNFADDVTVLRRGATVLSGAVRDTTEGALVDAMLGEHRESAASSATDAPGAAVLTLRDVSVTDARGVVRLADVSCDVAAGEIVGVAAVEGAGQLELLRVLAGRLAPSTGKSLLPADIGFVPADRQRDGLLLDLTLTENVALRDAGTARGLVRWRDVAARTRSLLARFDVRAEDVESPARNLSGGNQQKFVLGRALEGTPRALVVDHPTRGLDIRATEDVLARLRAARDAGVAVVMHSTDLDEILAVADRVLVVHAGRVREVPVDRELVGRAMLGAA
jgi:ABC-type uncharacterized transport system ATPase subunit